MGHQKTVGSSCLLFRAESPKERGNREKRAKQEEKKWWPVVRLSEGGLEPLGKPVGWGDKSEGLSHVDNQKTEQRALHSFMDLVP